MREDLVSVIIPVFNTEDYVDSCLESVVSQTYRNIEIIVVNDGSTDGSLKVLRKWESMDCRIRVIDKINQGVSAARNTAIDEANGIYIMFLDSDDWLRNDAIDCMLRVIKEEDSDIVICGICQIWENRTRNCKVLDSGEKTIDTEKMGSIPWSGTGWDCPLQVRQRMAGRLWKRPGSSGRILLLWISISRS